jgi:hypothetical protein
MKWLIGIAIVLWGLIMWQRAHAADGLPPYLKSETPGKVCVAIFDKFNELVGIDCSVPITEDNGKKEPIKKGE